MPRAPWLSCVASGGCLCRRDCLLRPPQGPVSRGAGALKARGPRARGQDFRHSLARSLHEPASSLATWVWRGARPSACGAAGQGGGKAQEGDRDGVSECHGTTFTPGASWSFLCLCVLEARSVPSQVVGTQNSCLSREICVPYPSTVGRGTVKEQGWGYTVPGSLFWRTRKPWGLPRRAPVPWHCTGYLGKSTGLSEQLRPTGSAGRIVEGCPEELRRQRALGSGQESGPV